MKTKPKEKPPVVALTDREKACLAGYVTQQEYHQEEAAKLRGVLRDLVRSIGERAGIAGDEFLLDTGKWEIRGR